MITITLEFDNIDAAGLALSHIKAAGLIPGMTTGTHTLVKAIGEIPEKRAEAKATAAIDKAKVTTEVTYDQVSRAITDKVKSDRAGVVAALTKFGAKKGTELKAEQYADFLKELG